MAIALAAIAAITDKVPTTPTASPVAFPLMLRPVSSLPRP